MSVSFPISLSPIELSCLLEESPSHRMEFFLRLHLDGSLKPDEFNRALQNTVARHPLFGAIVRQKKSNQWEWIEAPQSALPVNWVSSPGDGDDLPESPPIDIFKERGLRITVVENGSRSAAVFQFHHAVCDGLSASEFIADLLTFYAIECDKDTPPKFKRLEPMALLQRGNWGLKGKEKLRWLSHCVFSLKRFRKFYKLRPVFLSNRKRPAESEPMPEVPGALFRRFSRQESILINKEAKRLSTNVNGLLLTTMFSAFTEWREQQEDQAQSDIIRVSIPVSLRTASHRTSPAANIVSLVCFDRRVDEIGDRDKLIGSLENEIELIKQEHRGLVLPLALSLLQKWPDALEKGMRRKRFWGTTLISNLGPILTTCMLPKKEGLITIGDLTVENVEFLTLLRPGHCATMAACTYGGKITLGMRYDQRMISENEAEELFESYLSKLQVG